MIDSLAAFFERLDRAQAHAKKALDRARALFPWGWP